MATGGNLLIFLSAAAAALSAVILFPAINSSFAGSVLKWGTTYADVVVTNATIYTCDSALPFADSMAIRSGRILRLGTYSSLKDLVGCNTNELNLNGKVVMPGFIDSHVHLIFGGLQMGQVELRNIKHKDDFVRKVKQAVRDKLPDQWILGGGWNNDFWGGDLPNASWLDDITPNNPVWLSRMDGHMGVANSRALKIAGITRNSDDPVGGSIIKTTEGEPTGLLVDSAMKLVRSVIPEVSIHEKRDALIRASRHALMRGVTTVVDMGRYLPGASADPVWHDLSDVYKWADSAGQMMIRVCLFFPLPSWSRLVDLMQETGRAISQWIHLGGVKAFLDGSLGSNSALFYEPYEDDTSNSGLQVTNLDWLLNATLESDRSGLQVAIHAIGDKANDMVLDMFNSVASLHGIRDRRFRIEHAQHLASGTAKRFGQQRVIASVQPDHLLDDANSAGKKLGEDRALRSSYLFKSLLDAGTHLAFGSDWPVADVNPLGSIRTALYRVPPGWESAWNPSESVALNDAIKAQTISAAYACFLDHSLGSLSPGKYADFVVLPAGSWDELVNELPSSVLATYVNGKQAYP
ncbi:uncharacterized protein LOC109704879 [Ananas comosus]|uniref:Uncharacterized protein LOC109704879 n=1 Tax=Ananas comosus TaxID=4615 RepID=A0A6P5EDD5_ANACO|nr:uncharacterized protein LOC109704879 [Ananas comosus]